MRARDVDPLRLQALYYVATGVWPIVHLRSFYAVTGAKRDGWLVQTFGALIVTVGTVMWPRRTGAARQMQEQLATASAAAIIASEVVFTTRRQISPIYLADAALEAALALAIVARRGETKLPQR